jgi:glycosyltransferase involved in cell wall biosynthesis
LRYFVNRENIGMFGNFNRCIEHARGEWMTILNDDDLLDADFLERMFVVLDRDPAIDGLVPQKRRVDERPDSNPWAPRRGARAAFYETFFLGRKTRPIPVNRFFWAPVLGNVVALLFKTRCGREIGGFYPEDYPSDTWFYARFAAAFRLRQHKDYGASIRVGFNESSNPATIKTFLQDGWRFREALANGDVPAWWRRLSPHLSAVHRIELEEFWNVKMPPAEVEQMLDIRLPRARPRLLKGLRVLLRGF